jgi:AcrR family transcriptional regulator
MLPREYLLEKCLRYFLKHGVAHLSLRPLASAVGTSARMLVHHFGSKEGLITAVMEQVHSHLQSLFDPLLSGGSNAEPAEAMVAFWNLVTSRKYLPYMRLLFEVQILAIQNPARYRRYLMDASGSWLRLVQRVLPKGKRRTATATLSTAVIDGLMLEYLSTGDLRRTSHAVGLFLDLLGQQPRRRNIRGARA